MLTTPSALCEDGRMKTLLCPYCHEPFTPSRYRPDQVVCGAVECQRQRRAAYHRKKLERDADYREQCRESQHQWREQNPDYMRSYRQTHRGGNELRDTNDSSDTDMILKRVKNNVGCDLTLWTGRVYVLGGYRVKKILAKAD